MTSPSSSAADRAYEFILDGIIEGRFETGEMLSEATIAGEIELSRTPIRAALVRLQQERWITVYPKRGALVNGLSDRTIADLADTRLVLEAASMQRSNPAKNAQLASRLSELIDRQAAAFERRDIREFIDLTIRFHRSFVEAGENTVLLELNDRLADRQRYMLFRQGESMLSRCEYILDEHRKLVRALVAGDPDTFAETLRAHIGDTHAENLSSLRPVP
ncbi:GntR family transcriptional regulator [Leucobacter allii]|uniref:GntR family transcriptional regulator n=1 Tax=Leucobacter allii TaxID=2932247 RepID=UPI001FD2A6B8|nr:GntR family transcriptional regulator [Leucobacter allii]UOR01507.1 GntR family transcriptional regulator [Leucobacter allii]